MTDSGPPYLYIRPCGNSIPQKGNSSLRIDVYSLILYNIQPDRAVELNMFEMGVNKFPYNCNFVSSNK